MNVRFDFRPMQTQTVAPARSARRGINANTITMKNVAGDFSIQPCSTCDNCIKVNAIMKMKRNLMACISRLRVRASVVSKLAKNGKSIAIAQGHDPDRNCNYHKS